jgi:hypothetical protein
VNAQTPSLLGPRSRNARRCKAEILIPEEADFKRQMNAKVVFSRKRTAR